MSAKQRELERKHPGFSPSCIADVTKQMRGDTHAVDRTLREMEAATTTVAANIAPRPIPAEPTARSAKHAPTIAELAEAQRRYDEAARMLEGNIIDLAPVHIPSPPLVTTPSPATATAATATKEPSTAAAVAPSPLNGPIVTAQLTEGAASCDIAFEFSVPSPSTSDWIALFIHDRQLSHSGYEWTQGAFRGKGVFKNLAHGTYDVRLLRGRDSEHYLARSNPVLVGPPVTLRITGADTELLSVEYSGGSERSGDWIGLYTAGSRSNKKYLAFEYCTTHPAGTVRFATPRQPGNYDVRYFKAASGYAYSGAATVTVPNVDSLTATSLTVTGGTVTCDVVWKCRSRARTSGDWIGLFEPTGTSRQYLLCQYLSHGTIDASGNAGTLHFDLSKLNPGTYEFRLFSPKSDELPLRAPVVIPRH